MPNICNKILICLCCSQTVCCVSCLKDFWGGLEAELFCCLNCGACCWTVCAPICHNFTIGDFGAGLDKCVVGAKYCLLGCALQCVGEIDPCISCLLYNKKNFTDGVSGFKDVTQNMEFLGKMVRDCLKLELSNEPGKTFGTFTP